MDSRVAREMADVVVAKILHITDVLPTTNAKDGSTRSTYHYEMAPWETTIIIDSNATSAFTVYLPPVAEAEGRFYTIALIAYTNAVAVEDLANDSEDFPATIALNANYDRVLMYSDGIHWWIVKDMFS